MPHLRTALLPTALLACAALLRAGDAAPAPGAEGGPDAIARAMAKAEAYARVLAYPSGPDVDTRAVAALAAGMRERLGTRGADPAAPRALEGWLEAHAGYLDLAGRAAQARAAAALAGAPPPAAMDAALRAFGRALAMPDWDALAGTGSAAAAAVAAAEAAGGGDPLAAPNPLGWIKTFTDLAPSPAPWRIAWPDKAVLALCDPLAPPSAYRIESTWVATRFLGEQTVTFTALCPLIAVTGGDRLRLRGLVPARLLVADGDALRAQEPAGLGAAMRESWLIAEAGPVRLLIILAAPVAAWEAVAGGVDIRCAPPLRAHLLRLPDAAGAAGTVADCRFWARVARALPVAAVEERAGAAVTWRYGHERTGDAWATPALAIAPLPGLAALAGQAPAELGSVPLRGATFPVLRYAEGDALRLPLAAPASAPLRGVNVAADAEAGELAGLRARGATWIRLVVGRSGWADETAAFAAVRRQLAACRDLGLTVLIDPHDFIFQVAAWTDPMPEDERAVADFTRLWDGLARIGAEFPGTVAGYDLYNELLVRHDWDGWSRMATRAIAAIRRHDARARIYMTGLVMANPEGFAQARPLARDDVSYSFHFYRPHGFTHQKMHARQVQDPYVFYPGWIPEMDWKGKTHIGRTAFAYWDRWALGEAMLPVLAFAARNRVAVHCGEFGVIGYCKDQAMASAARWTGDSIAWFERQGMPWHLWNKGYGLCVPDVVPVVEAGWARGR